MAATDLPWCSERAAHLAKRVDVGNVVRAAGGQGVVRDEEADCTMHLHTADAIWLSA